MIRCLCCSSNNGALTRNSLLYTQVRVKVQAPILFRGKYLEALPAHKTIDHKDSCLFCLHIWPTLVLLPGTISFLVIFTFSIDLSLLFVVLSALHQGRGKKKLHKINILNSRLERDLDKLRMPRGICWYHRCHSITFSGFSSSSKTQSVWA